MIKNFASFLMMFFIILKVYAQHIENTFTNIVFVDSAKVRENPSLNAKVIGRIRYNTKVKICDYATKLDSIGGVKGYWYGIQFANSMGFIWGGALAKGYMKSCLNTDVNFLIGQNGQKGIEIKAFEKGELLSNILFQNKLLKVLKGSVNLGK